MDKVTGKRIAILGDTHAEWSVLNRFINKHRPDIILQCGDFGYWPSFSEYSLDKLKLHGCRLYFCDGNHEEHPNLPKEVAEVAPGVVYMPRGSTLKVNDKTFLFMGGAYSIDMSSRVPGFDWFPEETIKHADLENLPDISVDRVISHTCPSKVLPLMLGRKNARYAQGNDPSCDALDIVLDKYKPQKWYFGHWHLNFSYTLNSCKFTCLNMMCETGWYEWFCR